MERRAFFLAAVAAGLVRTALAAAVSIRGKLAVSATPALITQDKGSIPLQGDAPTMGVLRDTRLQGVDFEAVGSDKGGGFQIDPIHTRAMFVHKDGKRLMVTYWCDVCYIRTYTPGICWCCQKNTDLDLRESITD